MTSNQESKLFFKKWKNHLDNPSSIPLKSKVIQGIISTGKLISQNSILRNGIVPLYPDFSYDCAVLAFFKIETKGSDSTSNLFQDYLALVLHNTRFYHNKYDLDKPVSIHTDFLITLASFNRNDLDVHHNDLDVRHLVRQTETPKESPKWEKIGDEYWEPSDEVKLELLEKGKNYAHSLLKGNHMEVAEKIACDAYIALKEVKTIPENMEAYYMVIVKNRVTKYWARNISLAPLPEIIFDSSEDSPVLNNDKNYIQTIFESAMGKLGESHQTCIVLKYFRGFTSKEIASELDITEGTVNTRLSRARDKLKEILQSNHEFMHNYSDCISSFFH